MTFGALAGLVGATVLQSWLGVLSGDFLFNAAAIALFATAVTGTLAGLGSLLGTPGIGLGALLVFLVGNPLSAVAAAPELLPQPWGVIGQYLPIGAGGTLLRSTAFFDGAGGATAAWVLAAYAVVGLALVLLGRKGGGHGLGGRAGHGYGAWRSGRGARGRPPARRGGELTEHHPPRRRRRCGRCPYRRRFHCITAVCDRRKSRPGNGPSTVGPESLFMRGRGRTLP